MGASDFKAGDWREWRRLRAWRLKQQGWSQRAIAGALGVSEVSVSHWLARARQDGEGSLRARPGTGRPPTLSPQQRALIPEFLWHGPESYGFSGQLWTRARVALVIREEFGILFHKGHVGKLLKELHWTPQMPIKRAIQRDEPAIDRWRAQVWPGLLQRARQERRVLVFEDESGFYLLPGLVRTYAPQGQTPVIREKQTRDHLSVMGGMTPQGKFYTLVKQHSLNGLHVIEFLEHLRAVTGERRLLVIWDGSPIHRRAEVKEFVEESKGRIWVEQMPGYAPDLNPWDEGGWNHLKNVQMRNLVTHDLEELHEQFHLALDRLRHNPHLARSFFAQAGLTLGKT
jgi:transposase